MCGLIDFCRKKIWSQWISFFPSKVNKSTHLPHQKSINRVIIVPIETNLMAEISYHKISASKIKSWVWIPLIAKCTWYKIMFVSNFLQVCVFQWALLVGSNLKKLKMCSRYGSFEQLSFGNFNQKKSGSNPGSSHNNGIQKQLIFCTLQRSGLEK